MRPSKYVARVVVNHPKSLVYQWYLSSYNFIRAFPSWEGVDIVNQEELPGGQRRVVTLFSHFFCRRKSIFHIQYVKHRYMLCIQLIKGPLKQLDYQAVIQSNSDGTSEIIEKIEFLLYQPWFFGSARESRLRYRIKRLIEFRNGLLLNDLELMSKGCKAQKILITGAHGLVGSHLNFYLKALGHDVWTLVRSHGGGDKEIYFNPPLGEVDRNRLEGFDVVIHLSGESIQKRWTQKQKEKILKSRYETTKNLTKILAGLERPPQSFLSASAIGCYGDRGAEMVTEETKVEKEGSHFLPQVTKVWEEASSLMKSRGVRVVHLRFGIILTSKGGALKALLPAFKCGIGGILGSGEQYMSWVAIDDVLESIHHILMHKELSGPINITSPNPVTNAVFSKTLARYLHRSLGPHIPSLLLRIIKGEMADELLLSGARVQPKRLLESGYRFRFEKLQDAFSHLIR